MTQAIDVGSRRELFVDDYLVQRFVGGAALRLYSPTPREASLVTDQPWEGCMASYHTVFEDGGRFLLYYRGWQTDLLSPKSKGETLAAKRPFCICLAESHDGIHWTRPELGLLEYQGSRRNNIVWMGAGDDHKGIHGFSPFRDENPACTPEARYKAVGTNEAWPSPGLFAMISPDGVHWSMPDERPMITQGAFDSHNVMFWDGVRREYRAYLRDFREGRRDIRTATSGDFVHWSTPQWLDITGAPPEQLYTNNVQPYYRAPHIFVGFPARYVEREWTPSMESLPQLEHRRLRASINPRFGTVVSDAVFMTSRDGQAFHRWGEAFIRPGLRAEGNWAYGDNYPAWGMIETDSDLPGGGKELSLYTSENYWRGESTVIRRYSIRIDGFVSVNAPRAGGEIVTHPLSFTGSRLSLNVSASAAGSVRAEIQDPDGRAIDGFGLADCWEILGDTLDYTVRWKNGSDLARLADRPIRLRLVMQDADVYSLRFV